MSHPYFNQPDSFEALDEAPVQFKPLYLELTCCGYTTPDVISWPLTAGPDENGDHWGVHAFPGDEVPCPHCGDMAAVYAIAGKAVLPGVVDREYEGANNILLIPVGSLLLEHPINI